jgi:GNAT superfamily N-acetyltransferase
MPVEIVEARDAHVREAVFRFRYDIYVREMSRPQKDADHERARIEDALDADALLLAAKDAASPLIVGTVRANIVGRASRGIYEDIYGLASLSEEARELTTITTRMMIARRLRGTALAVQLASALFARGLDRGIETDLIDCNRHLVPFFTHLGYRQMGTVSHPEYGDVTVMRLDVRDVAHLRAVGSPLACVHERRERVA